jgi:hypothetical protein
MMVEQWFVLTTARDHTAHYYRYLAYGQKGVFLLLCVEIRA